MISRKFLIALLALLPVVASAQTEEHACNSCQKKQDFRTNDWFFGVGGGLNIGFDGHKYINRKNSHKGSGTALDVYFGKYFTKVFGVRVGYHGISSSNQYRKYGKDEFHYAHADLLFRAGNVFVPYMHGGYVSVANHGTPGFGVGLMAPIRLSKVVSIVPDLKATVLSSARFSGGTKRMGANLSGTLGVRISLPSKAKPQPVVIPEAPRVPVRDTIVIIQKDTVFVSRKDTAVVIHKDTTVMEKPELPVPKTSVVYFKVGKFHLDENSKEILDRYSDYLLSAPEVRIIIEGHASSEGGTVLNNNLARRRASVVREYLTRKGIKSSRITVMGKGSDYPIADNSTEEGRRLNRRAIVIIED